MYFAGMWRLFFVLMLCSMALLHMSSCETYKCEGSEIYLTMIYHDSTGVIVNPVWDRVYSDHAGRDLYTNGTADSIPMDMSRDSTRFIFIKDEQIDTLSFSYQRTLLSANKAKGHCIELSNPSRLEETTFNAFIQFLGVSTLSVSQVYEVHVRL